MQDLFREYYFCVPRSAKKDLPDVLKALRRGLDHRNTGLKCIKSDDMSDAIYYLDKLQNISGQKSTAEEKPDCNGLGFHNLALRVGKPVFVVYPGHDEVPVIGKVRKIKEADVRCWEIVKGVKRIEGKDYVLFKGSDEWVAIETIEIFKSEEGAPRND